MEKIDLKNLTEEEKEKILHQVIGFIKRHAPEVTAEDFKKRKDNFTVTLPQLMEKEINALVEGGYYTSKSELIEDTFNSLLESKADLKISAAVEMYKKEEITLGRASEIAGLSLREFKEILKSRGIKIIVEAPSKAELNDRIELMKH